MSTLFKAKSNEGDYEYINKMVAKLLNKLRIEYWKIHAPNLIVAYPHICVMAVHVMPLLKI